MPEIHDFSNLSLNLIPIVRPGLRLAGTHDGKRIAFTEVVPAIQPNGFVKKYITTEIVETEYQEVYE